MMLRLLTLSLVGLFTLRATAQDLSLLDKSTTCDATCKETALNASKWERSQHASEPPDPFYHVPASLNASTPPGTVLFIEEHTNLTNYTVPSGLTMSRILYTSQDLNGTTVLTSAFALWPYEIFDYKKGIGHLNETQPKYPLIAWAHGTSGYYERCAPSNYKALQYHFLTTFNLAFEGFAIIAPDYAGLGVSVKADGTPHVHQYLAFPSQANDLAFAIEAVRKAFPTRFAPDGPFIAMGHSQGGGTAWAFAERQAQKPIPGYKGTVAFSPPIGALAQVKQILQQAVNGVQFPASAFGGVGLMNAAITAVYPSFDYAGFGTTVRDIWLNVLAPLEVCLPTFQLFGANFPVEEWIEKAAWINRTEATEWEKRTSVSGKKIAGPFSVILGGMDVSSRVVVTKGVDATCTVSEGESIEYLEAGAMGHFGVMQATRSRWLQWVKDRISDKPLEKQCGKRTILPGIDTNYTSFVGAFPPNFLVEGVSKQEEWKLSL